MNYSKIQEALALATPVGHTLAADAAPAFVVQYVPSLGTGGSAATIALIQNGAMTFLVDGDAPAGLDAIGTAGVITTSGAAYDDIGQLVDYINSCPAWRAYICAAKRSDDCAALLAKSAASCYGDNGLTFHWDTSAAEQHGTCISGEKFVNNSPNGWLKDADHKCFNYLLASTVNCDMASAGTFSIYSCSQSADSSTIWTGALADATALAKGYDDPNIPWCQATIGERLVVRAEHASDIGTITTFNVVGKTAVLSGAHIVTGVNY